MCSWSGARKRRHAGIAQGVASEEEMTVSVGWHLTKVDNTAGRRWCRVREVCVGLCVYEVNARENKNKGDKAGYGCEVSREVREPAAL